MGLDDKIAAVLRKAAEEPEFLEFLLADREKALADFDLAPHERAVLVAAPRLQLRKMVEEARKRPWYSRDLGMVGTILKGGAVAAVLFGLASISLGATSRLSYENRARSVLKQIASAEQLYKQDHGVYGGLSDLVERNVIDRAWTEKVLEGDRHYEYEVALEDNTFTATARHKKRPDTRRAFQVGPDGVVKPLE